jgi:Ni/Co efflux regulator RcnB
VLASVAAAAAAAEMATATAAAVATGAGGRGQRRRRRGSTGVRDGAWRGGREAESMRACGGRGGGTLRLVFPRALFLDPVAASVCEDGTAAARRNVIRAQCTSCPGRSD